MKNKELIQEAVMKAHSGNNTIVETTDFVAGAWYMLEYLKEKGLIDFETVSDYVDTYKNLKSEGDAAFQIKKQNEKQNLK